ncbi:PREDICTED: cyclin-SDS [Tarenaya hassleriana]|uniref:cyclin-SDS n=1 Tax=Tarenaya hassleriana TaxID=28532 RepID=UPI00053C6E90|nr:PREDICTED: cyclin-SDS [Tarenaya hassleriana]
MGKTKERASRKKLRSTRSRRKRAQISPVIVHSALPRRDGGVSAASIGSSFGSYLDVDDNVSCGSSRVEKSSIPRKRRIREVQVSEPRTDVKGTIGDPSFRRITRSFSKLKRERERGEVEVSEYSCVESNSGAGLVLTSLKTKDEGEDVKALVSNENDEVSFTRSDVTFAEHVSDGRNFNFSSENKESDVVSVASGAEDCSGSKFGSVTDGAGAEGVELSEISIPNSFVNEAEFTLGAKLANEPNQRVEITGCVSDLACTEQFSGEEVSEHSENAISELHSEIFPEYSDLDSSDYTPSIFFDSGSQFSEKSGCDSPPSETRSLFLDFKEQFWRSTIPNDAKPYCLQDNLEIHPEQSTEMELEQETMFLGVSLLDRFLSKGSFKSERSLIIVGISCLTLATRLEENQPYNSVRQRNFYIQKQKFRRCEVVAMEWLVQEVLNFRCLSPTIYNFLWFYIKAARASPNVEKRAKYLAVMALSDHTQLCYWPSTVAAGVVILACIENNEFTAYQRVIEVHVITKDNDLPECVKSLEWLLGH